MDRREFLQASISSVLAAVGLGIASDVDSELPERHGGKTVDPEACDQCAKLAAFQNQVEEEKVPNIQHHRDRLKACVDPQNHTWEGDCLYTETTPVVNEIVHDDQEFDKGDVREMDYDINISYHYGLIDVTAVIRPPMPLRVIESTVTVGDCE